MKTRKAARLSSSSSARTIRCTEVGWDAASSEQLDVNASQPGVPRIAVEALVPIQRDTDFGERDRGRQDFDADKPFHGFSQAPGNGGDRVGAGDQCGNAM